MVNATNKAIKKNPAFGGAEDGRWDKNDTKDSANVANLVAQGKCQYLRLPEPRLGELRSLLLFRKRLKKQVHSWRVRIGNNLVAQYFPEFDRFWKKAASENLEIVRGFLDPGSIRQLTCEQFMEKLSTARGGLRQQQRLRQTGRRPGHPSVAGRLRGCNWRRS